MLGLLSHGGPNALAARGKVNWNSLRKACLHLRKQPIREKAFGFRLFWKEKKNTVAENR